MIALTKSFQTKGKIHPLIVVLSSVLCGLSLGLDACGANNFATVDKTKVQTMPKDSMAGEVLVKFKASASRERIDQIIKESGLERIGEIKGSGIHRVRIVDNQSAESVMKKLISFEEVEYAEPNFRLKAR